MCSEFLLPPFSAIGTRQCVCLGGNSLFVTVNARARARLLSRAKVGDEARALREYGK